MLPELKVFVVRAEVILRHGPMLAEGIDTFTLRDTPELRVAYERHGTEIVDSRQVLGALGGWRERFNPPGVVTIESRLTWKLPPGAQVNVQHRQVQLVADARDQYTARLRRTLHTAMAAFEMSTDSHVQVWGVAKNSGSWLDRDGNEYTVAHGSGEIEQHPVSVISGDDTAISGKKNASLLAAYAVARLNPQLLAPEARIVFSWALLERLVKRLRPGVALKHVEIRDFVLHVCETSAKNEPHPPVSWPRLKEAVERAYTLRNCLSHGEPESVDHMDFPALARAAALLARCPSAAVPSVP